MKDMEIDQSQKLNVKKVTISKLIKKTAISTLDGAASHPNITGFSCTYACCGTRDGYCQTPIKSETCLTEV